MDRANQFYYIVMSLITFCLGSVSNVVARRFSISGASEGVGMYQTNDALPYVPR